jgi:hypothetical protein
MLPTLCTLGNAELPDHPLDGIDLMSTLQGKAQSRSKPLMFWNFKANKKLQASMQNYIDPESQKGTTPLAKQSAGLYTRNFKNFRHPSVTTNDFLGSRSIIGDHYKLVIDGGKDTGVELFDLRNDISESQNIASSHPEVVTDLSKQLKDWQDSVMKSLMGNDYRNP